jgi:DNA-binding transcriptional regulator GbsR (MarR family)
MTEMHDSSRRLADPVRQFIVHWGEMGTRWGINRSVAQMHALLFVTREPMTAEDIAAALSVARSNVSTSLRELQAWGLVKMVHVLGDRRDHFQAEADVWETFRLIAEGRKRREVDPALERLRECVSESRQLGGEDAYAQQRMRELLGFFESMTAWYRQVQSLPPATLARLIKLGGRIARLVGRDKP